MRMAYIYMHGVAYECARASGYDECAYANAGADSDARPCA